MNSSNEKLATPLLTVAVTLTIGLGIAGCTSSDGNGDDVSGQDAIPESQQQLTDRLEEKKERIQERIDKKLEEAQKKVEQAQKKAEEAQRKAEQAQAG